MSKKT
jgi:hypothetical protein